MRHDLLRHSAYRKRTPISIAPVAACADRTLSENVMQVNYSDNERAAHHALHPGLPSHEMVGFFIQIVGFLQLPPAAAASMAKLGAQRCECVKARLEP